VKTKAAARIAPKPSQDMRAATKDGRRLRDSLDTATRAPRASSHARVNGEKKAVDGSVEVSAIDNAYEPTIVHTSTIVRRMRSDERRKRPATTKKHGWIDEVELLPRRPSDQKF